MANDDETLAGLVSAIASEDWVDLDDIVERLATDPHPYAWRGGDRLPNGAIQMPWIDYGDSVRRALAWLDQHQLVTPFANWTDWYSPDRYPDAAGVAEAPVADVVRLVTSLVRGDRFTEGAIAAALDSGVLLAILRRLRRWNVDA